MKRFALAAILLAAAAALDLPAQTHGQPSPSTAERSAEPGEHKAAEHGESDGLTVWKWANFAMLAGVLGWVIAKGAPQFFRSRSEQIQRGIAEATRMKQDAEARAAKMEMRMATLQSEIEHVRAEARGEMAKETARIRKESEQHIARIQAHGEQEISAMAKHAEQRLRAYSAELALKLAEERIRMRMNPASHQTLFDGFLRRLNDPALSTGVRQ